MTYLPAYVLVTGGAALVLDAACAVLRYATTGHAPAPYAAVADRYEAWRDARLPRPEPESPRALAAALRRLATEVQTVADSDRPAKALHLRAALLAYDDVLVRACRRVGLEVPTASRLSAQQRLDAESALLGAGFTW